MREDGYRSILASVLLSHPEAKDRTRCAELIEHLRESYASTSIPHQQLLSDCLNFQVYVLEVCAQISTHESLVLYIFNDDTCRQHTINQGETYRFELGAHRNFRLKFAVARFNGESRKAVVRSSSFIRRVMSLDRREGESVQLSTLPVDAVERKYVAHKGHGYATDIKVTHESRHDLVPALLFEDLLNLTRTLHEWEACVSHRDYDGELSDCSFALLHSVLAYHEIPAVANKTTSLCIFLVWDYSLRGLDDSVISRIVGQIKNQQLVDNEGTNQLLLDSLSHLSQCVQAELDDVISRFDPQSLFPPEGHLPLKKMNLALKSMVDICVLSLWDLNGQVDPSSHLSARLSSLVRASATQWVEQKFHPDTQDIKETCLMIQSMWDLVQHNYQSFNLFFHQFNINYVQVTLSTIDEKLESSSRAYLSSRLASLDSRSPEQLELFSKCTMRFYDTIASISKFALQHRVKNLRIHGYEGWFIGITVFWTFSWRQLSLQMVERTVSLDNDGASSKETRRPLPDGLYSFLCIQKGLSDDYSMLSFKHPENIMMGTMALVHIYCENVCAYGRKLYHEAMSKEDELDCRLIRAANGVEQSLEYIEERWRRFLDWDENRQQLDEKEAEAIETASDGVMQSTRQRCSQLIHSMLRRYCSSRKDAVTRLARSVCLDSSEYTNTLKSYMRDVSPVERTNATMEAVDSVMDDVRRLLLPRCFDTAVSILFEMLESAIDILLKKRQPPDYYANVYVTIKSIMDLLDIDQSKSRLLKNLHYRSFSTQELILSYFSHLSDLTERAAGDAGAGPSINIRISQTGATGDNILLSVTVLDLNNFPPLNPLCDRVDPYVRMELLPRSLFPEESFIAHKTRTLSHCSNPCWKQDFRFLIPHPLFFTNGASLCISLLDHDRFCDQLLGRSFISLSRVPESSSRHLLSPLSLPLLQPGTAHHLPFYRMLKDRCLYDSDARFFISRESTAREMFAKVRRFSTKIYRKNKCI